MASTSNIGDVEPAADPVVSVPGAEIADPRRQVLIDQLDSLLSNGTGNYRLRQGMWACLWLCSVEILESIVRTAPSSTEMLNMVDSLFTGNYYEIDENIVKPWTTRRRARNSGTADNSKYVSADGDTNLCAVTKSGHICEVAHIYPYSMNARPQSESFWRVLEKYWDTDLISRWKTHVFGQRGTGVCQNMITLSPSAHAYWGAALFALKPVSLSKDRKELVVQFFWLRPLARVHRISLRSRPVLHGDWEGSVSNIKLFNCQTDAKICSGDHITLTTEDPTTMPLPSIDLLEMQWVLHRLTALSGGAEPIDLDLDSDDGGDEGADDGFDDKVYSDSYDDYSE